MDPFAGEIRNCWEREITLRGPTLERKMKKENRKQTLDGPTVVPWRNEHNRTWTEYGSPRWRQKAKKERKKIRENGTK